MVTHNLKFAIEYGNRLIMMHKGNMVIDAAYEKKDALDVDDLLNSSIKSALKLEISKRRLQIAGCPLL